MNCESVAHPLKLNKLEGDAALFYASASKRQILSSAWGKVTVPGFSRAACEAASR